MTLTQRSTVQFLAPGEDLCQFALKSVNFFSKYSVHKLVTDKQMDRQADEWTNGQVENTMLSATVDWIKTVLTVLLCVFYDAEHILSAIAKCDYCNSIWGTDISTTLITLLPIPILKYKYKFKCTFNALKCQ